MATGTDTGQIARLEAALKILCRRCADQTGQLGYPALNQKRRRVITELSALRPLTQLERIYLMTGTHV
jgi:hypothetical protein